MVRWHTQRRHENHIGVCVWGGLVLPEMRQEIANYLGIFAPPPPKVTTARVYGYGLTFGLASGDQQVAQREATKVFGARVKVMSTRHLQRSGTVCPVYDVELTVVPAGWEGSNVPASDTRLRERSWQRASGR